MSLPAPYLPLLYLVLWWCFILFVLSTLGGWRKLSEIYRFDGAFPGRAWRFQSIAMRWWTGYGNCVHVAADGRGLYLRILFLFRPGHPPLLLPWEDLSVGEVRAWGRTRIELRSRRAGDIPVRIHRKLGEKIFEASEGGLNLLKVAKPGKQEG